MYERNFKARSRNNCCHGKAKSIIYSECVSVDLGIQHEMCVRCIILLSVACLPLSHFSSLSYKRHDFRKIVIKHNVLF
jgi:hypothetical protein